MSRPVLLMIHGLVGPLDYFDPRARISAAGVATLDLLGYGAYRETPDEELSLSTQADHVLRFLSELGTERTVLAGHSMGGAVVMLAAARGPGAISGIINIEGNFTLKDAFWSEQIASQTLDEWLQRFDSMRADVAGWLKQCGIEPSDQRIAWAQNILDHQPARTVRAMSKAILEETGREEYLAAVRGAVDSGVDIYLVAGARSAAAWDVPDFVRRAARSYTEIPSAGHMMMLEKPDVFCGVMDGLLWSRSTGRRS
jgi:pimeloyl-ACP methyl ester carboxylesterase